MTTPDERRQAIPTLSIFDRVVILLEHLTRAAGERLGAVEVPMMDEIRTHHSVEFVQSFVNSREIPRTLVRGDSFPPLTSSIYPRKRSGRNLSQIKGGNLNGQQ